MRENKNIFLCSCEKKWKHIFVYSWGKIKEYFCIFMRWNESIFVSIFEGKWKLNFRAIVRKINHIFNYLREKIRSVFYTFVRQNESIFCVFMRENEQKVFMSVREYESIFLYICQIKYVYYMHIMCIWEN